MRGLEDSPAGQCGVAMQGSFPVKSSPNPPPSPPAPPEPPAPPSPEPVQCDDTTSCPNGAPAASEAQLFLLEGSGLVATQNLRLLPARTLPHPALCVLSSFLMPRQHVVRMLSM